MKHFYHSLVALVALFALPDNMQAQGWPANYGGVMFQSFAWDSYTDTQWTNLTSQADTLSKYFNLIWVPQSGYCNTLSNNMGYYDIWWFDQKSAFGTADQLRTMISTFKAKGTGIIADVVINHKNGNTNWIDFPDETYTSPATGKTYTLTWHPLADICNDDEANTNSTSPYKGQITGAADTGEGDGGCRDLDHTNTEVQNNIKTYTDFLLNEMGYTGFRYDMTKGYAGRYTKMYNESAKPAYSVGEYWDGNVNLVKAWVDSTGKTSAAFDFPMKYLIKNTFSSNWANLANYNSTSASSSSLVGQDGYSQYAVTFVDNHDTGEPHSNPDPQRARVAAANAFILAMPGTPCIWLTHWKNYKTIIKKCILARKLAGVTNTSTVESLNATSAGAVIIVDGSNGNKVLLVLGSPSSVDTNGYQLACEGDDFKYYISNGLDLSQINSIKDEEAETHEIPSFCKVNEGETCAFFEVPSSWGTVSKINCWAWDNSGNYTGGNWPGVSCTLVGTHSNGSQVYKWTWDGSYTGSTATTPANIIFSAGTGSPQQNDMTFKNGNYYGLSTVYGNVIESTTGINTIKNDASTDSNWYTISGSRFTGKPSQKGVYIHNGKKVVVK